MARVARVATGGSKFGEMPAAQLLRSEILMIVDNAIHVFGAAFDSKSAPAFPNPSVAVVHDPRTDELSTPKSTVHVRMCMQVRITSDVQETPW